MAAERTTFGTSGRLGTIAKARSVRKVGQFEWRMFSIPKCHIRPHAMCCTATDPMKRARAERVDLSDEWLVRMFGRSACISG